MGIEELLKENNQILKKILEKLNCGEIQPNSQIANEVVESLTSFADLPDANSGLIPDFNDDNETNKVEVKIVSLGKSNIKNNKEEEEQEEEQEEDNDFEVISVNEVKKVPKKVVKKAKAVKKAKGKAKKQGGGKKPSDYQLFMKKQIPIYKKKNPKKSHREAFSAVAKLWKKQKN